MIAPILVMSVMAGIALIASRGGATEGPKYVSPEVLAAQKAAATRRAAQKAAATRRAARKAGDLEVKPDATDATLVDRRTGKKKKVKVVPTRGARAAKGKRARKPEATMSKALQSAMAGALRRLTVDNEGVVRGPVLVPAIRAATQIAGRLDRAGFPDAAKTLRKYARIASQMAEGPIVGPVFPLPPSMTPKMKKRVRRMINNERDPEKLQGLVDALRRLPKSKERNAAIATLKALILQIETADIAQDSLEKADEVMKKPTGDLEPAPKPTPIVVVQPPPPPPPPEPKPELLPKNPTQQAAEEMSLHLRAIQGNFGMPGAHGKEDKSIVRKFQKLAEISQDGLAGPGTLGKAASMGQFDLPLVMYWPRGASRRSVQIYRDTLRRLADETEAQGFKAEANQLRMVAGRETGQGGVAQYGAQLV